MNNVEGQLQTRAVVANAVALGNEVIRGLVGSELNGNAVESLESAFAVHLNNELQRKGDK